MKNLSILAIAIGGIFLVFPTVAKKIALSPPKIQLASQYAEPLDISQYWVSEKLDGIRGYWDGQHLFTRSGHKIFAPQWFTLGWPKQAFDGELWSGRSRFENISSCVRKKSAQLDENPITSCWKNIRLMLFDLPHHQGTFSERINQMELLTAQTNSPYLAVIKQTKLSSNIELNHYLDLITKQGGEGLMLHHQLAKYKHGRSQDLIKLKKYQDAEAIVIDHIPGQGKFNSMLGSLLVKTPSGIIFRIGTGFSDRQRKKPPKIGDTITYKYVGKSQRGVPKFASFMRIKQY